MMGITMRRLGCIFSCLLGIVFAVSCRDDNFTPWTVSAETTTPVTKPARIESEEIRNVVIMVSGGFNSLSSYLRQDLMDLSENYLPGGYRTAHVLLVLSRLPADGSFSTTSAPVLYRMYREEGGVVRDTLKIWPQGTQLFGGTTLRDALQFAYDRFPAKGYGMVLSSHGSGWLPEEYYFDPSKFETNASSSGGNVWNAPARRLGEWHFPEIVEEGAPVKSIGQDKDGSHAVEMDLLAFRDALPFHLDYLLLDACLSGGVEVAYELREKVDVLGFSQTELLAEGFDYETLMSRLLVSDPDPVAACRDAYNYYDAQTGINKSAVFSAIDLREMEDLSGICRTLFQKYRYPLAMLQGSSVQGYFRYERHFFYDLKDILVKAGISAEEEAQLDAALAKCVIFKGATPYFMQGTQYGFAIQCHSGFSMYLPSMGSAYLDQYYKDNMAWNQATGLVQ